VTEVVMDGPMTSSISRVGIKSRPLSLLAWDAQQCCGDDSQRFQRFTGGMGVWRVLDSVWRICERIINDGISWWRGDIMNVQNNGLPEKCCPIPCQ